MDMIFLGQLTSLFQAYHHMAMIWSRDSKIQLDS